MKQALKVRLTGRAARWVQLLREYGHLDDDGVDLLLVAIGEHLGARRERLVDLPDVRRLAAGVLFDRSPSGEDEVDALEEDWPLLFS